MRFCTTPLSALFAGLCLAVFGAIPPTGTVAGEGDALYRLTAPLGAPAPPEVSAAGYRQSVRALGTGWEVTVSVHPQPISDTTSFRPNWSHRSLADLPPDFLAALRAAEEPARTPQEACAVLALFLRTRLAYEARSEDPEEPASVCRRGRASCVGIARVAACALEAFGLSPRPVIGLRAPCGGSALALEGGALHVWLLVDPAAGGPFFFDPAFSSGWIPERYVVLRVGRGWDPGELLAFKGGTLDTLWRRDRLFYFQAGDGETVIWSARELARLPGAALSGKLLDGADVPLEGTAYLRGSAGVTAVRLWQGNFCFQDLEPGDYELAVESKGRTAGRESFTLGPMDKRTLVFYSRD